MSTLSGVCSAAFKSVLKDPSHRPSPSLFALAKIKTLALHLPHHQNEKSGDEEHILYRLFYFNGGKKKDSTEKKILSNTEFNKRFRYQTPRPSRSATVYVRVRSKDCLCNFFNCHFWWVLSFLRQIFLLHPTGSRGGGDLWDSRPARATLSKGRLLRCLKGKNNHFDNIQNSIGFSST